MVVTEGHLWNIQGCSVFSNDSVGYQVICLDIKITHERKRARNMQPCSIVSTSCAVKTFCLKILQIVSSYINFPHNYNGIVCSDSETRAT